MQVYVLIPGSVPVVSSKLEQSCEPHTLKEQK